MNELNLYLGLGFSGLVRAEVVFVVAAGLTLIFGVVKIINFAHGSFYMVGAFIAYSVVRIMPASDGAFWVTLVVAAAVIAAVGILTEVLLLRPIYARAHLFQILLTYGLTLVIADLVRIIWGTAFKTISPPLLLSGSLTLMGRSYSTFYLFVIGLGITVLIGMWLMLEKTRFGLFVRAASLDSEMLGTLGINVPLLLTAVFAVGSALAGFAGAVIAPSVSIDPGMEASMLTEAFLVIVIGGMGSIWGAFLASIIIGEVFAFGTLPLPQFAIIFPYIIGAIVLIVRPQGLFGRAYH
jgi:branched-chain amino acid transport system permease protein